MEGKASCRAGSLARLISPTAYAARPRQLPGASAYAPFDNAQGSYEYRGQTVFNSTFGGKEVVAILERAVDKPVVKYEYRLVATNKTSTMQKELSEAGAHGFDLVGMTVAQTAVGGDEIVAILRRKH